MPTIGQPRSGYKKESSITVREMDKVPCAHGNDSAKQVTVITCG